MYRCVDCYAFIKGDKIQSGYILVPKIPGKIAVQSIVEANPMNI